MLVAGSVQVLGQPSKYQSAIAANCNREDTFAFNFCTESPRNRRRQAAGNQVLGIRGAKQRQKKRYGKLTNQSEFEYFPQI